MAGRLDQNTMIGLGAGAALGALAAHFMKKGKKGGAQRLALGAVAGAAVLGGGTYLYQQQTAQAAPAPEPGAGALDIAGVDAVKTGSGAFIGLAAGSAFGQPVLGAAVGAGAAAALSKWQAA